MSDFKKTWDDHYSSHPFKDGVECASFLKSILPRLQKGKVLDIAMGEGQNAVFMAQQGFMVKGIDLSSVAISHALDLAGKKGVSIDAKATDLDMLLMGLMEYDSILMLNYKPATSRYYSELIRALKQGGTLAVSGELISNLSVYETQRQDRQEHVAMPRSYYKPNELLQHLIGLRILYYHEFEKDGLFFLECLAQKPMDKNAAKYGLFDMHTKSESSEKNAQMKAIESLFKKS